MRKNNTNNDIIQDTSAPPIILDTSIDPPETLEKMLEAQREIRDKINITFSMEQWKINTLKKIALEQSVKTSKNIAYTDLIKESIDKNYFQINKK